MIDYFMQNLKMKLSEIETASREELGAKAFPFVLGMLNKSYQQNGEQKTNCTVDNFAKIFMNDPYFSNVRYNTLKEAPEKVENGKRNAWTDADDADARRYIETVYKIYNISKSDDAFRVFLETRKYNPVQDEIEQTKWDGKERCERFLIDWMGAADNEYNRECSRLIFAGGINRAYNPGCKFDDVIVLIGGQGGGKSTLCRWLAICDDFYASVKTISGQKGNEAITGIWIGEIEELLAMYANEKSTERAEENAKAFISGQYDHYRIPYDRHVSDIPRKCIMIGTTNRNEFLTDKTGNRRWYPVRCNQKAETLYNSETECKNEIRQAWAEMLEAYKKHDPMAYPAARPDLLSLIRAEQEQAEIEDWREGMIAEYIAGKEKVCIPQIWCECLYKDSYSRGPQSTKDSREIGQILRKLNCKPGNNVRFKDYGSQKAYIVPGSVTASVTGNADDLPF